VDRYSKRNTRTRKAQGRGKKEYQKFFTPKVLSSMIVSVAGSKNHHISTASKRIEQEKRRGESARAKRVRQSKNSKMKA